MAISYPKNKENSESSFSLQPYLLWFVAVVAASLIIIPLLPGLLSNLIYSFSGHAPKIYWYLSRSAGFVSLTILWVAMALGLSITNKMARLWPGAPAAFAMHEYVSLLGLAFAIYHGLVLMGDHFVDFSLPRLLTPFSIGWKIRDQLIGFSMPRLMDPLSPESKPFWIGLGQVGFYIWVITALSFYVRRWIGQKTWRVIHYVNFAAYIMGWLHGTFSGTDSSLGGVRWYYWISGGSLLILLSYRLRESALKKNFSLPHYVHQRVQSLARVSKASLPKLTSLKDRKMPVAFRKPRSLAVDGPSQPSQIQSERTAPASEAEMAQPEVTEIVPIENQSQPTDDMQTETFVPPVAEVKKTSSDFVEKYEWGSGKNKINVRIFKEPTVESSTLETEKDAETKQADANSLALRLKEELAETPLQPSNQLIQRKE